MGPVIKLKYGDSIIKSGSADNFGYQHPTETGYTHQTVAAQPATEVDNSHLYVKGSFMAEESQESVNGWVLGAIASAVSGLALLGYPPQAGAAGCHLGARLSTLTAV